MSLQWGLIASFLYLEIAVVILLLVPFISAQRWNKIFKSRFIRALGEQVHIYFYIVLGVLILCLFDAVREMRKYDTHYEGKAKEQQHQHLEQELRNSMVLFRAQRNFYITGFSLFLVFVIRRLTTLLSTQAMLSATSEAALKQAESASKAAKHLMSKKDEKEKQNDESVSELEKKINQLQEELEQAKKDRSIAIKDLEAIKSQSEGTAREYDRLVEEHNKLSRKIAISQGDDSKSDKKDD